MFIGKNLDFLFGYPTKKIVYKIGAIQFPISLNQFYQQSLYGLMFLFASLTKNALPNWFFIKHLFNDRVFLLEVFNMAWGKVHNDEAVIPKNYSVYKTLFTFICATR